MKRFSVLSLVLAGVSLGGAALVASPSATLLLKSGARVSGQLVDLNASGFVMSTGAGERRVPRGDVAVIDFQGEARDLPATEVERAAGGRGFAVLRGGSVVEGHLTDVGGRDPLRLSFDTSSGARDLSSSEVARIYLSAVPAGSGAPSEPEPPAGSGLQVRANQRWTRTGLTVRQGDRIAFLASGEVRLSDDANDVAGPAGSKAGRKAPRAPLPDALAGALIGRIGNGVPFGIGDQTAALAMPASGELFLGVNDDFPDDNRGTFAVEIRRTARSRR